VFRNPWAGRGVGTSESNFDKGISLVDNIANDLGGLASIGIDEGDNLRFSRDGVADAEEREAPSRIRKPLERLVRV
jgi:hypothetical protein